MESADPNQWAFWRGPDFSLGHPWEPTMRVPDAMTEGVESTSPASAAEDVWNAMRTKCIHRRVVTKGSRIVGILSDRDAGGRQSTPVRAEPHGCRHHDRFHGDRFSRDNGAKGRGEMSSISLQRGEGTC